MTLPKFKWWQWALIGLLALTALSVILGRSDPSLAPAAPAGRISGERTLDMQAHAYGLIAEPMTPTAKLTAKARQMCGPAQMCDVVAWGSEAASGQGWPLTDREREGVVYTYKVNRVTGYEGETFDCAAFPDAPKDRCG